MSYSFAAVVVVAAIAAFYLQEHSWEIRGLKYGLAELKLQVNNKVPPFLNDLQSSAAAAAKDSRPIALIAAKSITGDNPAHLFHVQQVFQRLGYRIILGLENYAKDEGEFDVFWNHEFPFMNPLTKPLVESPKEHQKINHIPGSGYYTSKVALATANLSIGVPLAFALPKQKAEFEEYAKANPQTKWVQKSNAHRNIKVLPIDQLETSKADTFIQKFVENPLLIDGKKFDIGIYTVITSVSPLRVYIYDGDALIRFCAKEYEPFDAEDVDRYVVGDDYTPLWEIPSLKKYFIKNDLTFKESLNAFLESEGKNPDEIWNQIREIIQRVFESQNSKMLAAMKNHKSNKQFFELSRFDFVVDSNLKVFLMEANMSPNLSSGHFKQNRLLYEQVIFNVLSLIGGTSLPSIKQPINEEIAEMQVSEKDLNLNFLECDAEECSSCTSKNVICKLCKHCIDTEIYGHLRQTFLENLNRRQMRRILPRKFGEKGEVELTEKDLRLSQWLDLKCKQNRHFCE